MMSLRKRLGRGLISVLSVIFVMHWLAADWVIRSVAEKQMSTRLVDDAYSLAETLVANDDDSVSFDSFHISSVYNKPMSGHFYQVKVDARAYPSPSLGAYALDVLAIGPDQSRLYHLQGPNERPLLVFGIGVVKFGHRINISVAEDLSAVDHDITTIRLAYLSLTLLILVSAIGLQRWDIKRSLRPVLTVGQELERVAAGEQTQINGNVPVEIRPLVKEINRLLDLVDRRLQQSRTAMGNLAHALKSPIGMLFKVSEHGVFEQYPELRRQLKDHSDAIYHCIERELKRARIAGNQQANMTFNPQREMADLTLLMNKLHSDKHLSIDFTAPDSSVHYDREDMLEMIGNLVDNACKWAKHRVCIQIALADALTIEVADDGPGCNKFDAQKLTQRGLRLDESVQGHGLGLAIVSDIVGVYKGDIHISRSQELGGFLAKVRLPLYS